MTLSLLLASSLFFLQSPTQPHKVPLRNTFIVAAESVIDDADSLEIKAPDAQFDAQMQQLKAAQANLDHMVAEDGERDVVDATKNLVFAISACHIQTKSGAGTASCESIVSRARTGAMQAIDKHKSAGTWLDGPPA
jgi:hypothetical protein